MATDPGGLWRSSSEGSLKYCNTQKKTMSEKCNVFKMLVKQK